MICRKRLLAGFTLIELLMVVAIVIFIGTFSVVFFTRFLTQNATANTQDQLVGELRKAQIYAMMGKQNGPWGVHFGSNTLTLFQGSTYASRNSVFDEISSQNPTVSITGFNEIDFAKTTGLPSTTGTFTISDNSTTRQVVVNAVGVVSR